MKKRWLSILLALCLVLTLLPTAALAAEDTETERFPYEYQTLDGNTAVKISHPQVSPNARRGDARYYDGVVDYVDGQLYAGTYETLGSAADSGARGESYSWSAIGYGDSIYVGLLYNAMGQTIKQFPGIDPDYQVPEKMNELLDVLFNGDFFIPKDGGNPGGALVKINAKTGDVKILMSKATEPYSSCGFRNAVLYKDKIYFCGNVGAAPQIWQVDTKTDECKFVYGMSVQDFMVGYRQGISTGIRGLCVYEDKLVISCVMPNPETGNIEPQIAISDDPESGFTVIATQEQLFNYPAYHFTDSIYGGSIWEIVEFNHKLYVSICTGTPENMPDPYTMQSFAIVCGEEQEDGSWTWRPVVGDKVDGARYTFGIDPARTRAGAGVLMVYGDYLYIGEYNDEEIALIQLLFNLDTEFLNRNLAQSVSLYRMDKDENMELVVGDATEMFPDGGFSGIGSGFGRHENQYIWRMAVHHDKLYVGTFDTSSLLEPIGQFVNGDLVNMTPNQWKQLFAYIKALLALSEDEEAVSAILPAQLRENASRETEQYRESIQWLLDRFDSDELAELFGGLSDDCFADTTARNADPVLESLRDLGALKPTAALRDGLDGMTSIETIRKLAEAVRNMIELARKIMVTASYLYRAERGCDLYATTDGEHFTTLTTNGFGDPFNHGLRVFAQTRSGLGFGTANPFYGTQWWYMDDEASFDYDFTALTDDWAGDGWEWEQASKTLTLSGADIRNSAGSYGVKLPDGATIVVNGENTVTGGTADGTSCGIQSEGALTITGSGKLTAVGGAANNTCGIRCGALTLSSGEVSAIGGTSGETPNSFGIFCDTLTVNGGTLYASGETQALNRMPANQGSLSVSGSDTLDGTLTGQSSPDYSGLKQVQLTKRPASRPSGGSSSKPSSSAGEEKTENAIVDAFVDVQSSAYYYDAVRWAAEKGVTGGTDAAHFSPHALCSRAQAVTFLWRAAGSPVVSADINFSDIPADAYYAEAVRWAVSMGITNGTSAAAFSPDAPCTRGQVVTFLYRGAQAKGEGLTGQLTQNPFADVASGSSYWEPTMWALANGVTAGTSETTFSPHNTCTRAQIVTFLYRSEQN